MLNNKTVIIDFGKISTPYCGLAEVALNFAESLQRQSPNGFEFVYIVPKPLRPEFDHRVGCQALTPRYQGIHRVLYYLTGQPGFLCKLPKHDMYHYLHFYSPWGPRNADKNKHLLTIHDFHALERRRASKRLTRRLKQVDYLAFISNFAAEQYHHLIQPSNHITRVIANGVKVPPAINFSAEYEKKYGDFLFTLGGLKRKNIHSLVGMMQIFSQKETSRQHKLLIAGSIKDKYKHELISEAEQRGVSENIIFLGAISEQDKFEFLSACRAFVFPSLQEGFGLPVIEALHFGKPVFCSNRTSLPEVGGDKVYYWQQFDADYMADVLIKGLADNDANEQRYREERKQYALTFNWDDNVRRYVDYYKSILAAAE